MPIRTFEVAANAEKYEAGGKKSAILFWREVSEKTLEIINVKQRKMIAKKSMNGIGQGMKDMKGANNLQLCFKE